LATPAPSQIPTDPEGQQWDVVIVGTGMGGATLGLELAKKGHKVLFLEKGLWLFGDHNRGDGVLRGSNTPEHRLQRGFWPHKLSGKTSFGEANFHAAWGCGSGGGTSVYAAQQERFLPSDFSPRQYFPNAENSSVPEHWPITCEELAPYYAQAEQLFEVRGTKDPLHPDEGESLIEPPPLDARDQALFDSFTELGLHPYRSHIACRFKPGCEGCTGGLCHRQCRSGDAGFTCVLPAVEEYGAKILTECEVTKIESDPDRATGVRCVHEGKEMLISGKIIVLAAGAYMSPVILLKSKAPHCPSGLANSSDMVGRNLMVHTSDYIAVRPDKQLPDERRGKSIALNDFYVYNGVKLGSFQSVPLRINWRYTLHYLRTRHGRDPRWWLTLLKPFYRPMAIVGGFYYRHAKVFATVVEDLPYLHNRIILDENSINGMRFEYDYADELLERNKMFRKEIVKALKPKLKAVVLTSENNLNYGHVCGTCRFAGDPKQGVLDRNNRAHDVENLYVVDASFFPSSSGINPSLTIAANAIRVAEKISLQLNGESL
jgi:choline dehydrogenase-like flavoprotein